jgi:hypothetical protein
MTFSQKHNSAQDLHPGLIAYSPEPLSDPNIIPCDGPAGIVAHGALAEDRSGLIRAFARIERRKAKVVHYRAPRRLARARAVHSHSAHGGARVDSGVDGGDGGGEPPPRPPGNPRVEEPGDRELRPQLVRSGSSLHDRALFIGGAR